MATCACEWHPSCSERNLTQTTGGPRSGMNPVISPRRSPSRALKLNRNVSKTLTVSEGNHELELLLQGCFPDAKVPIPTSWKPQIFCWSDGRQGSLLYKSQRESPHGWKRREPIKYQESKLVAPGSDAKRRYMEKYGSNQRNNKQLQNQETMHRSSLQWHEHWTSDVMRWRAVCNWKEHFSGKVEAEAVLATEGNTTGPEDSMPPIRH